MRQKYRISLTELAFVSGIPRPTVHAIEQGRFNVSREKLERLKLAIKLIADYKKQWQELPKDLERKLKSKSKGE